MITTSLEAALLILTVEFGVLVAAITFFAYRGARTVEAESTAQAIELVRKVANTEDARSLALQTVFKEKYQFEGDELTAVVDEFMQREKAFYNAVVGAFLGRGSTKISDLNDELTKVVAPWISITPKNMVDRGTAESLAQAKSKAESELGETKQVLEKMMAEYNRAFHIEPDEDSAADVEDGGSPDATINESEQTDDVLFSVDLADDDKPDGEDQDDSPTVVDDISEAAAEASVDSEPTTDTIKEPADDDDVAAVAQSAEDPQSTGDEVEDPGLISDVIEELDDDDDIVAVAETPQAEANKPMTADDLDDLMESLEADPLDEIETA